MRLNGWQRLWVVLAAIYSIIVCLFTVNAWPDASKIRRLEVKLEDKGAEHSFELLWGGSDMPSEAALEAIWKSKNPDSTSKDWFEQFAPKAERPYLSTDPKRGLLSDRLVAGRSIARKDLGTSKHSPSGSIPT